MFELQVDASQIANQFDATQSQLESALKISKNRTAKYLKTQLAKHLSNLTRIKKRNLMNRILTYRGSKLFIGLNPISYSYLDPTQTKAGVQAQHRLLRNAFILRTKKGPRVYKREGNKKVLQKAEIHTEGEAIIETDIIPKIQAKFLTEFERNLRWKTQTN